MEMGPVYKYMDDIQCFLFFLFYFISLLPRFRTSPSRCVCVYPSDLETIERGIPHLNRRRRRKWSARVLRGVLVLLGGWKRRVEGRKERAQMDQSLSRRQMGLFLLSAFFYGPWNLGLGSLPLDSREMLKRGRRRRRRKKKSFLAVPIKP
ncbi:hypothetical protein DAPPUDRAFT_227785 [Daphnia pulex]|uniref:Transmembrane protein n=1 Tax=Daphnia pulex TaxID=6669 RepID=E9H8X7_DAPPU|nr:hypothetical protein DAPPUDRAFT_227785 [Daphnia pulex]|eukprot:EFX71819.1 hypothetical protein DAPPUDRAFT_227785 [Daphnia pulex]